METWKDLCKRTIPGWKEFEPQEEAEHTTQALIEFMKQSKRENYTVDRSWNPVMKEEFARLILNEAAHQKEIEYYI